MHKREHYDLPGCEDAFNLAAELGNDPARMKLEREQAQADKQYAEAQQTTIDERRK